MNDHMRDQNDLFRFGTAVILGVCRPRLINTRCAHSVIYCGVGGVMCDCIAIPVWPFTFTQDTEYE